MDKQTPVHIAITSGSPLTPRELIIPVLDSGAVDAVIIQVTTGHAEVTHVVTQGKTREAVGAERGGVSVQSHAGVSAHNAIDEFFNSFFVTYLYQAALHDADRLKNQSTPARFEMIVTPHLAIPRYMHGDKNVWVLCQDAFLSDRLQASGIARNEHVLSVRARDGVYQGSAHERFYFLTSVVDELNIVKDIMFDKAKRFEAMVQFP